jgi:hypothetical protein
MDRADAILLADLPFGYGNLANLRAAREAAEAGRPVLVLDLTPVAQRDFTGGVAALEYQRLLQAGAFRVTGEAALAATLEGALRQGERETAQKGEQGGRRRRSSWAPTAGGPSCATNSLSPTPGR